MRRVYGSPNLCHYYPILPEGSLVEFYSIVYYPNPDRTLESLNGAGPTDLPKHVLCCVWNPGTPSMQIVPTLGSKVGK